MGKILEYVRLNAGSKTNCVRSAERLFLRSDHYVPVNQYKFFRDILRSELDRENAQMTDGIFSFYDMNKLRISLTGCLYEYAVTQKNIKFTYGDFLRFYGGKHGEGDSGFTMPSKQLSERVNNLVFTDEEIISITSSLKNLDAGIKKVYKYHCIDETKPVLFQLIKAYRLTKKSTNQKIKRSCENLFSQFYQRFLRYPSMFIREVFAPRNISPLWSIFNAFTATLSGVLFTAILIVMITEAASGSSSIRFLHLILSLIMVVTSVSRLVQALD